MQEYKLSAKDITPTGPLGMATKGDVLAAIRKGQSSGSEKEPPKEEAGQSAQQVQLQQFSCSRSPPNLLSCSANLIKV